MSVRCWLRAETHDGNDPVEAMVLLPSRPQKGDLIEVWNRREGGYRNSPRPGRVEEEAQGFSWSGEALFLEVEQVVLRAYGDETDETLEVWVKVEGYDLGELRSAMGAANRRNSP